MKLALLLIFILSFFNHVLNRSDCKDPYCSKCYSNPYNCMECVNGYGVNDYFSCVKLVSCLGIPNCDYCSANDIFHCFQCSEHYKLNNKLICVKYCYDFSCDKCSDELQGSCLNCKDGWLLISGKCVAEGTIGLISFFCSFALLTLAIILVIGYLKGWFQNGCKNLMDQFISNNSSSSSNAAANNNNNIQANLSFDNDPNNSIIIENIINSQHNKNTNFNNIETCSALKSELPENKIEIEIPIKSPTNNFSKEGINKVLSYSNQEPKLMDTIYLCIICLQNPGVFKSKCGCYLCIDHKNSINSNENNINHANQNNKNIVTECPKCKIKLLFDEDDSEVKPVKSLHKEDEEYKDEIDINMCGICYEINNSLASYHDECALKVCRCCHYKCLKNSRKCPYCRLKVY